MAGRESSEPVDSALCVLGLGRCAGGRATSAGGLPGLGHPELPSRPEGGAELAAQWFWPAARLPWLGLYGAQCRRAGRPKSRQPPHSPPGGAGDTPGAAAAAAAATIAAE